MTRKSFNLIKQMNEQVDKDNEVVDQSSLSEADMSPTTGDIRAKFGSLRELQRIANYWKEHGQDLDDAELRERIGMDLEQLEYDPDQQAEAIPKIMQMIQSDASYTNVEQQEDADWVAQKNADERYGPVDDEEDEDDEESDTSDSDLGYVSGEDPDIENEDPIAQKNADERYGPRKNV